MNNETFDIDESDYIQHYGTPRHSGRYPWGSGENPYQSASSFYSRVHDLRKQGISDVDIAKSMSMNTLQLRAQVSAAYNTKRAEQANRAQTLKDKGYSNVAIGKALGVNESSVRSLLDVNRKSRNYRTENTANALEKAIKSSQVGAIDVGKGVEAYLGVSETMKKNAIAALEAKGYKKYNIQTYQLGTGNQTTIQVLAKPGMTFKECAQQKLKINMPDLYVDEAFGNNIRQIEKPVPIKRNRVQVVYGDKGGVDKDGLIELRRDVPDISLGRAKYAQVRINVDDKHYLKGMAVYADDLPKGIDIRFNTNKKSGTPDEKVFKPLKTNSDGKIDWSNPFGATIKDPTQLIRAQHEYIGKDGKKHLSAINIVNEEGDWAKWSHNLPSQFLGKQPIETIKKQLGKTYSQSEAEFKLLKSLTNPVVKAKMLNDFAENCDGAAVHLKAAALPRQATHVILPFKSLKSNEIYARGYRNGEEVMLVRYPHAGRFELPVLRVNNKNRDAVRAIGNAFDAVGINSKVAQRLSGADFDGDSVTVIPLRGVKLKSEPALPSLKNFDPGKYAVSDKQWYHMETDKITGKKRKVPMVTDEEKQALMGNISNLITDMTIKGATPSEIARADRHSMVVIDCVKHQYDYKASARDNGIAELKTKYQGGPNRGASTLLSKASSDKFVDDRRVKIDPKTGRKVYSYTGKTYTDKNGVIKPKRSRSTKMAETEDAYILSSGSAVENSYAKYANQMKHLANESRRIALASNTYKYSPSAAKAYSKEVKSLRSGLLMADKNAPLERAALKLAGYRYSQYVKNNPDVDADSKSRRKGQELNAARKALGAKAQNIVISDREWEAIQAGAISKTTLKRIMDHTDTDRLRELATPKQHKVMTDTAIFRARSMANHGATIAEIADQLGVSPSTISKALNE